MNSLTQGFPPSIFKKTTVSYRLFLILLIAGLLSIEILSRMLGHPPKHALDHKVTEYDAWLGWKIIPNVRQMFYSEEYQSLETFNSKGIRGPEYAYEKKQGMYRILVTGDSHAEGYSAEFENHFAEQLEKSLNAQSQGVNYETINAGVRGYSPDQSLIFFEREGKQYHPDLTILVFCVDDVWLNALSILGPWQKPVYAFKEGRLTLTNVPVGKAPPLLAAKFLLKQNCYSCNYIYNWISHSRIFSWLIRFKFAVMPEHLKVWAKEYDDHTKYAWSLTEEILKKFKAEAEANGGRFLIFYVPPPEVIDEASRRETIKNYGMFEGKWDMHRDSRELEAICQRNHMECVIPVKEFQNALEALKPFGKSLYYQKDPHWTLEGHSLAAQLLKDAVLQS